MAEHERNYADECGDHGGVNSAGEPCGRPAGWGTDFGDGRCKHHRGTNADGSSHKNNTNAVTHGAYADEQSFYANELNEPLQNLADEIFNDYLSEYEDRHGRDPPKGLEVELKRLSISHVKDIVLDQWSTQRAESLESGNPLVDRETERDFNPEDGSVIIEKYKESVVLAAQKKLSNDRRMWLKDLGLLEDPESQKADNLGDIAELWRQDLEGE